MATSGKRKGGSKKAGKKSAKGDTKKGQPAKRAAVKKRGIESKMRPRPEYEAPLYRGSGKLQDKVALITGGDSGIGRAVAVLYARGGAGVAIVYLSEEYDARETAS